MVKHTVKSKVVKKQPDLRDQLNKKSSRKNANGNHCADMETQNKPLTRKRYRESKSRERDSSKRNKSDTFERDEEELDYFDDQDHEQENKRESVRFEEDNNIVEISLNETQSQFMSEDENDRDSEFSEREDGELEDESRHQSESEMAASDAEGENPRQTTSSAQRSRRHVNQNKNKERRSLKDQLDQVSSTLQVMQEMMIKKGIFNEFEEQQKGARSKGGPTPKRKASGGKSQSFQDNENKTEASVIESNSETTIYKEAVLERSTVETIVDPEISFKVNTEVEQEGARRGSSSSEEPIDTSDELMDVDNFIADCEAAASQISKKQGGNLREPERDVYRRDPSHQRGRSRESPGDCHTR